MRKIFIFFLFILFSINSLLASQKESNDQFLGCNSEVSIKNLKDRSKLKIEKIEIDTNNYRRWAVNSMRILTSGTRFIADENKRKFKSKIIVTYEDKSKCFLKGRIRQSGDAKDHIALKDNSVIQSLDVQLDYGNIRGITRFKLFKPDVRGNLEDVIIQTQMLRNFGYLAPRSLKVLTRVNQTESIMLFQEKAAKEMLEFNNRREGPILEGDQKFFFKLVENIPDNNLSNWSVGTPILRSKSSKVMLSKLTNANLINRSEAHKSISLNSVNNLNLIYLYYSNRFKDNKNDFFFFDYDLDNTLLAMFEEKNTIKLNIYNLLMQSTNSQHALSASNRKFYWNAIENYFEPINYDANPEIDRPNPTTTTVANRFPINDYYTISFDKLEEKILKIDLGKFSEQINLSGLDLSQSQIKKKVDKILTNFRNIKENYTNIKDKEIIAHNSYKPIENILNRFNNTIEDIDPNTYLIRHNNEKDKFERCKIFLKDCKLYNFSNQDLTNLLEGELKIDNTNYQYLGSSLKLENLNKKDLLKKIKINNSQIFYEEGIKINFDKKNNLVQIVQSKPGSKAYFINGNLKNLDIVFDGYKIFQDDKNFDLKTFPSDYPINTKSLTGCLSLINLIVEDINIKADNSSCEDTINFINSKGNVQNLQIKNSFSDALDVDFSNLIFNNIEIFSAKNDCTDFSSGNYKLGKLNLMNCGDKGLSIGERSFVELDYIKVENANIGVAAKDSSISKINSSNFNNLKTCLSAYNKKQEYDGAIIEINNLDCKNYFKLADIDNLSKISSGNEFLINNVYGNLYDPKKLRVSQINGKEIYKNYIKDHETINKDKSFNVVIEIPSGTSEKWEVSKLNGSIVREFYMGKPRDIEFGPYPVNYGILPRTVLPISRGGDGDPLDIFVLGSPLTRGEVVKVRPIGVVKMNDTGDQDDKIIAVHSKSEFNQINNIEHLNSQHPEILKNIKYWFENYKGKNVVEFVNFGSAIEAKELIELSRNYYKRLGVKPRS